MITVENRLRAGVEVPDTPVIDRAIGYAREKCEPYLFNHVMRSWLFAVRLGQLKGIPHDAEIVAVGTLLHDITLNESYAGPRRFEVEAADLVRSFAAEAGMDDRRARLIWDCVALNSSGTKFLMPAIIAQVPACTTCGRRAPSMPRSRRRQRRRSRQVQRSVRARALPAAAAARAGIGF